MTEIHTAFENTERLEKVQTEALVAHISELVNSVLRDDDATLREKRKQVIHVLMTLEKSEVYFIKPEHFKHEPDFFVLDDDTRQEFAEDIEETTAQFAATSLYVNMLDYFDLRDSSEDLEEMYNIQVKDWLQISEVKIAMAKLTTLMVILGYHFPICTQITNAFSNDTDKLQKVFVAYLIRGQREYLDELEE